MNSIDNVTIELLDYVWQCVRIGNSNQLRLLGVSPENEKNIATLIAKNITPAEATARGVCFDIRFSNDSLVEQITSLTINAESKELCNKAIQLGLQYNQISEMTGISRAEFRLLCHEKAIEINRGRIPDLTKEQMKASTKLFTQTKGTTNNLRRLLDIYDRLCAEWDEVKIPSLHKHFKVMKETER